MGAHRFQTKAFGKTADEAFKEAKEDAEYHHGKGGYTGTIAEKNSFTVIPESELKHKDRVKYAQKLMDDRDDRIYSKWGPAGAIRLTGKKARRYREFHDFVGKHGDVWLFFGWASS